MRIRSQLVALCVTCITTALSACSVTPVTFNLGDGPLAEDCAVAGDEDGNGVSDCGDPACAGIPACQPACGNSKLELDEGCDDGNSVDGDGCSADCKSNETCGNGIVDTAVGEICDDGNMVDGDACSHCSFGDCGNGIVDLGEECDLGLLNSVSGDCRSDCVVNRCGDGWLNDIGSPGHPEHIEQCDAAPPAPFSSREVHPTETAGCNIDCSTPVCGDGKINGQFGEQCDNGLDNGLGKQCNAGCQFNICGDGDVVIGVEQCDAGFGGTPRDSAICDTDCTLSVCGDGHLNTLSGEVCEDGNMNNGDGCSATCVFEF
jgi:cysteine-rich repeat protein